MDIDPNEGTCTEKTAMAKYRCDPISNGNQKDKAK